MHIRDVVIIGAGPAGLAVAARLREDTPSATFTDDEHQRYHWIRKHGRKMNIKNYRTNRNSLPTPLSSPESSDCGCPNHSPQIPATDTLILDADGSDWMTKWKRLFKTFHIDYLRSPMFFHVDPADRDALLGYTYEQDRENEIKALPGCAGKEISKHRKKKKISTKGRFLGRTPDVDERDRKDYFVPSTELFDAHCAEVVRRYGLGKEMVRQERVLDLAYDEVEAFRNGEEQPGVMSGDAVEDGDKIFRIKTDQGVHYAHVVVLAVGPGNAPSIPRVPGLPGCTPHEGYAHAMQLKQYPPPHVLAKVKARSPSNLMVIGGGLTSIQLADLAVKRGVSKVWMLMRGPLKVKYFDVDLDWVGKFRNFKQAEFWTADTDEERFEMIRQARNGGSMTPRYRKVLDAHVASGKISLHLHTTLESVSWDRTLRCWTCKTLASDLALPPIDHIVFATGIQSDIRTIPFMQTIQKQHPIECVGGLPCLNDDLMWNDNVPLFVTGRLAGLRLGPGAPNLVGARIGAERIAWNVDDVLRRLGGTRGAEHVDSDSEDYGQSMETYAAARDNRFGTLADFSTND